VTPESGDRKPMRDRANRTAATRPKANFLTGLSPLVYSIEDVFKYDFRITKVGSFPCLA